MKILLSILGLLGFRWWETTREYQAPHYVAGKEFSYVEATWLWRHQRCALSGRARRQYDAGHGWKTDKTDRPNP